MESSVRPNAPIKNQPSLSETLRIYLELSKVRIVILLVFTCVTAMVVAANGLPPLALLIPTIIGGTFASAGASAINQYIDREMDAKMNRTSRRPIPSGRIAPVNALLFGMGLVAWSVFILGLFVNWLAAGLALVGAIYYVVIYTLILKRNTVVNIVIGGGAGAMPVLVGWSAITGSLSLEPFILFAIVFYWTPPHSWALALLVNKDYAAANVPMMPVARGEASTRLQILLYSVQLVLITLLPGLMLLTAQVEMLGWVYLVSAALLGYGLLHLSWKLLQDKSKSMARVVYKYSSLYLAALFLMMIVDRLAYAFARLMLGWAI